MDQELSPHINKSLRTDESPRKRDFRIRKKKKKKEDQAWRLKELHQFFQAEEDECVRETGGERGQKGLGGERRRAERSGKEEVGLRKRERGEKGRDWEGREEGR